MKRFVDVFSLSILILLLGCFIHDLFSDSKVIHYPKNLSEFKERLEWALTESKKLDDSFWIGYSILKPVSRNVTIGCTGENGPTLMNLIYGSEKMEADGLSLKESAKRAVDNWDEGQEKIKKEIAVLLRFPEETVNSNVLDVNISDLDHYVDLKNKELFWLGEIEQETSAEYLSTLFRSSENKKIKSEILTAIALHQESQLTMPFLEGIINNESSLKLRKAATFWLSQQENSRVVPILVRTAQSDRSEEVRKQAVFALSQVKSNDATEELIKLAKNKHDLAVQKQAIFWLSQKATENTARILKDMAFDDDTIEIQKQAVFALSQLKNDDGISQLIVIARTHASLEIRKTAIFWLGQSNDPRALEAILDLVRK